NLKAGEYDTDIGKVVLSWDEDAQVFYYDHPQTGNRIALGELGKVNIEFSIPGILRATDVDPKARLRTEIDAETDIETKSKLVDQYNLAVYEQSGLDASAIADIEAHASDSNYVFYDNRWYTLDELREMKWTEKDIEESLIITHRMIENKLYPADYLYMDSNGNTFTDQEWLDRNPGVEMFVMDMDNSMFDASLLPKLSREFALHIKEHGVLPSEYIGKIKAFSGIPELISSIPKKRLMILSNGYGYYHRTVLKEIGLLDAFHNWNIVSSFDETARVIRTNDRTDPIWEKIARSIYSDYDPNLLEFDNANLRSAEGYIGKPNAYLFEKITAQKGIPSDKFVFVTDSASEIWPTQNIGWKTIYVKGFDQEWDEQMITGIPGFQDPEFVPDAIIRPNEMTKLGNIVETMDLRSQVRQAPDYESKLPLIKKLNARIRTQNGFTEAHIGDLHAHLEDGELFNNGEWYPIEEFKARDWTEKEIDEEFTKTHKYVEEALYPPDYVYMDKAGNTFTDQDWVEQHPGIDVVVLDIDNVILMKKESIRVSSYNYNYAKEHGVLPPEINENYFVSPGMPEFISTIPIKRRMILTNDYLYYQKTKLKSAGIDNEFMDWKMRGVGDEVVKIITIKDNSDPMWVQVQEYVNEEIEEGYSSDEFDFEHDDFVLNYVIRQLHLGKNGPNLFQRIMKQTDVVPERIFYVDDYGTAIQESTMLGWKTVYVKGFDSKPVTEAVTGTKAYPAEFPPTKVITIEEFNQLPEILWELSQVEQN
ncbi:MAG: hypothetical protein KKF44_08995, partial [Nanoarchaeota archaeon]|nr:hypothetical protein [Nanoarchaeota archaeon]